VSIYAGPGLEAYEAQQARDEAEFEWQRECAEKYYPRLGRFMQVTFHEETPLADMQRMTEAISEVFPRTVYAIKGETELSWRLTAVREDRRELEAVQSCVELVLDNQIDSDSLWDALYETIS